jgi:hypothetical protein
MSGPAVSSRFLPLSALAVAALALTAGLPTGTAAQSRLSAQGLKATMTASDRITVRWRPGMAQRHYWCAAAELATAQGMPQTTRLARLDTPARFTDPVFSTDPADVTASGSDSLGRSATGLFSFPRGNSLTVGFAASLCDLDHIMLAVD